MVNNTCGANMLCLLYCCQLKSHHSTVLCFDFTICPSFELFDNVVGLNDSVDVTSEPDDQDMSVAASSHNPNKGQLEVQLGGAVTLQCPQGSLGCWSHLDPVTARLRGLGHGLSTPTGQFSLKDVVYQDAGTYKCIGQSPMNKKKLEVLQTVAVTVKEILSN
uniref:IG domain-containing protein n=1 Tax=Glossina austeni TaxID=7395 RepID=A0A1A9VQ28_GLOAU